MDLNKLSYNAYGNIMIITLVGIAILFNLFPFTLIKFITCLLQIPIYLIVRSRFEEPIHAIGLNICFILTTTFYILLYGVIELLFIVISMEATFIISSIICILSCYATSTLPQKQHDKGKLFFGKRKEDSEYQQIYTWIRLNQNDKRVIAFEENIKRDGMLHKIYMNMFINGISPMKMADKLNFKSDIVVYPYVNRIIGRLSDSIYEIEEICLNHENDAVLKD